MVILFLLGGLQGAIGWIMVQSGLNDSDIGVDHIRLAIHFICALFLLVYLVWFTLMVSVPAKEIIYTPKLKRLNIILLILLFVQLIYGAFMAGTHAALNAPTWPDINGLYIPTGMFANGGLWHNLYFQPLAIQFVHRTLAYLIGILVIVWFYKAWNRTSSASLLFRFSRVPLLLVIVQITLGVLALLNSMYKTSIYYSVVHQFMGMLLLTSLVVTLFLSKKRRKIDFDS